MQAKLGWCFFFVLWVALMSSPAQARKAAKRKRNRARPVPALTASGLPNVMSKAALVVDLDTGEEVYAQAPDEVRFIASTSKLFVAMAVRGKGFPLEGKTTITPDDVKWARGGARSRLLPGRTFSNHDLLRAMLIASDNRACTALARAAGMTAPEMVAQMNAKARRLGLRATHFTHPSGLDGNVSSARELVIALRAALEDPVIAEILGTHTWRVHSVDQDKTPVAIDYTNTNQSLFGPWQVLGGKTGYTDEARYCLTIAVKLKGRRYGMAFLGAEGELTRFADFNRVVSWLQDESRAKQARAARKGAGAHFDPPPSVMMRIGR